ncbi:MAG: AAA family ATPase [Chloroflexota bacterium]
MPKSPIFILTGTPASGKTTLSKALLNRFSYGTHIPVDNLRGMVVSGLSNPIGSWDDETDRQFRLARDSAAQIAKTYAKGGFAVAIDDVIFPDQIAHHYDEVLAEFEVYKILVRPSVETAVARNKARQLDIDPAQLEKVIQPIYNHFATFDLPKLAQTGWAILDTSFDTIDESIEKILAETGCFLS